MTVRRTAYRRRRGLAAASFAVFSIAFLPGSAAAVSLSNASANLNFGLTALSTTGLSGVDIAASTSLFDQGRQQNRGGTAEG